MKETSISAERHPLRLLGNCRIVAARLILGCLSAKRRIQTRLGVLRGRCAEPTPLLTGTCVSSASLDDLGRCRCDGSNTVALPGEGSLAEVPFVVRDADAGPCNGVRCLFSVLL